jgi:hypothetical protein
MNPWTALIRKPIRRRPTLLLPVSVDTWRATLPNEESYQYFHRESGPARFAEQMASRETGVLPIVAVDFSA